LTIIPKSLREHINMAYPAHVCLIGTTLRMAMLRSPRAAAQWCLTTSTLRSGSAALSGCLP